MYCLEMLFVLYKKIISFLSNKLNFNNKIISENPFIERRNILLLSNLIY